MSDYLLTCLNCGDYLSEGQKMFCSNECRHLNNFFKKPRLEGHALVREYSYTNQIARNDPRRECDYCRRPFIAKHNSQYYCSPTCRIIVEHEPRQKPIK